MWQTTKWLSTLKNVITGYVAWHLHFKRWSKDIYKNINLQYFCSSLYHILQVGVFYYC